MSKWTNVRKFDFVKEEYSNSYYKLTEFNYFVDSEFGSDTNDGLTPQTAFKSIDKIAVIGISQDSVIAISGVFYPQTDHSYNNYAVKFVGVGGYNGRAVISGSVTFTGSKIAFENCIQKNLYFNPLQTGNINQNCCYHLNCVQYGIHGLGGGGGGYRICGVFLINSFSWNMSNIGKGYVNNPSVIGYNSTAQSDNVIDLNASSVAKLKNTHILSSVINFTQSIFPSVVVDTNSRYFTDNTETTPADLYIDSANGNFGIVPTFSTPIWDKQTQQYITENPLYHTGADGANIGAGVETLALTALDDSLKSTDNGGDATYSNMENDQNSGSMIFRIDDSIDGTLVSGVQDLGRVMNGVKIDAIATYDTNGGLITKRLQQSTPSIEQTTDFGIQFGETEQECRDMTPILCEYGKVITYSKSGNVLYGNSDLNFQPNKKKVAKFRYFIISIRAKTIS